MRKTILLATLLIYGSAGFAQLSDSEKAAALQLVTANAAAIDLQTADIGNSIVTGTYIIPGTEIRMVYLQQAYKGIPVYNQLHVLAFQNGKVVSIAGSRIQSIATKVNTRRSSPAIDPVKAVTAALKDIGLTAREIIVPVSIQNDGKRFEFGKLGIAAENIFAELLWFPEADKVSLVWQVFIAPLNSSAYWFIRIDAITGKLVNKEDQTISCNWGGEKDMHEKHSKKDHSVTHFIFKRQEPKAVTWSFNRLFVVNNSSYRVVKYPAESPQHPNGTPQLVSDPWNMSPGNATTHKWHYNGSVYFDSLRGNNAFAYEDRNADNQPGFSALSTTAQPTLTFDFTPDFSLEPIIRTPAPNQQFNTTNLFYWNNLIHDLSYIYGFTESSRNYQNDNLGRGGVQGDYVLAEAQDGSGTNNANFSPGADGTRGRMQMFLWPTPNPDKDGDADNGVIAHEYTHGISNRMTASGAGCLNNAEQMGEGWSDYLGLMITHDWAAAAPPDGFNNPRGIGTYVLNQPVNGPGIRQYRYTTNMAINPMTYGNLPTVAAPHGVGTIWCTALWDMTWYIIQQAGINPNLFDPLANGGNSIALKLVIEGLRLQPCSPGFIDGRNAILKADTLFFGAQYSCAILEAFARRGMGIGASQGLSTVRGDEVLSFVDGHPIITTQPQNISLCAGSSHTFTVVATGADLHYQWQLSTNGGGQFNDIAGANTASYSVSNVTIGMDNYRYRCLVTGCPPTATSTAAILTVVSPPAITSQPGNVTVCEGANASFSVTATGTGTQYQWQVSSNGGANYSNINGANSSVLNLIAVNAGMNNNLYRVLLSNSVCTVPVNSIAGILMVNTAPSILTQPQNNNVCIGSAFTLCATVSGTSLIYQWQSSPLCSGPWTNLAGGNSSCLTVNNATTSGAYRLMVNGVCGGTVISNCAFITVVNPVTINTQPANTDACNGGNATISINASSAQPINYQWQISTDGGNNYSNINNGGVYSGVTTANLQITGASLSMNTNRYRVLVSNATCSTPIISNSSVLTVHPLPTVSLTASPLTNLLPGQLTTLTAALGGTGGVLTSAWFYNNNPIANNGNTRIVNVEQIGSYRVNVIETFAGGAVCVNSSGDVVIDTRPSPKLFIFPSPNDGRFYVSYYNNGGTDTQRRIVIFDAKGSKVYDRIFPITGPYTLLDVDMRAAGRGIYFVSVGDINGDKLISGKVHVH